MSILNKRSDQGYSFGNEKQQISLSECISSFCCHSLLKITLLNCFESRDNSKKHFLSIDSLSEIR